MIFKVDPNVKTKKHSSESQKYHEIMVKQELDKQYAILTKQKIQNKQGLRNWLIISYEYSNIGLKFKISAVKLFSRNKGLSCDYR